jgi:hypothetical protein
MKIEIYNHATGRSEHMRGDEHQILEWISKTLPWLNVRKGELLDDVLEDINQNQNFEAIVSGETDLTKNDGRIVIEPFTDLDKAGAALAQRALQKNSIKPIKLKGKHTAGTSLFLDEINHIVWLLKPGRGGISKARGVSEENASGSRREVAFNAIASKIGLSNFVPQSYLLEVSGEEVAMLQFFADDFDNLNHVRRERTPDSIFQPYVSNGVLHRIAFLDYLLGQTDRHAGNVLVNKHTGEFKLIDAGSAFAGPSFSPTTDSRSFIPVYLRGVTSNEFSVLTPQERYQRMPKPSLSGQEGLKVWVQNLPEGVIINLLNKYGINPQPVMDRLQRVRDYSGPVHEFLNKFWSGVIL